LIVEIVVKSRKNGRSPNYRFCKNLTACEAPVSV